MKLTAYNYYSESSDYLNVELKRVKRFLFYFYLLRLISFLLVLICLVLFVKLEFNFLLVVSFVCFAAFLWLIRKNAEFLRIESLLIRKILIIRGEQDSIEHKFNERETGERFARLNPHLAADFDLFGAGSIYQYLNRSVTFNGKARFAESLCKSELNGNVILDRQSAIHELSCKNELILDFQSHGMLISEKGDEISNLRVWLEEPEENLTWPILLSYAIPLLVFVWIALVSFGTLSINSLLVPILTSLTVIGVYNKRLVKAHSRLGNSAKIFKKYYTLIKLIEKENFESQYLIRINEQFAARDENASLSLKRLFKLLDRFDLRLNVFAFFVLNSLFLFDIHVYCQLAKWKKQHKDNVSQWFDALAEFDSLVGFATFAFNNHDQVSFPSIVNNSFSINAEEIGHPLIPSTLRVCNSIHFEGTPSVVIITGANMAGKSTFLRTLAVNLILAMNGSPVCAKKFEFAPCDLMSSTKIQDALSSNESYFYAELLRIKEIIEHVESSAQTLVVLDEILRGTNTKDKQIGSLGLLEKLIGLRSVVIIATHDLAIGDLERKYPSFVKNYCFEVELNNDQLIFDYKLKNGISQKLNASFLLRKMGIVDYV